MKIDDLLIEARKNPDVNQTDSNYEQYEKYKNDPDVYVSFSENDKIGIKTGDIQSTGTPLSINAYPLMKLWDTLFIKRGERIWRPHGHGSGTGQYTFIIKPNTSGKFITNFEEYTEDDYIKDIKTSRRLIRIHRTSMRDGKLDGTPFEKLWTVTRRAAEGMGGTPEVKWNSILRNLGYSGFENGRDIKSPIKMEFGTQAIFLQKSAFDVIERIDNYVGNKDRTISSYDLENVHYNTFLRDEKLADRIPDYINRMEYAKKPIPPDVMTKLEQVIAKTPRRAMEYATQRRGDVSDIILKSIATERDYAQYYANMMSIHNVDVPDFIKDVVTGS